jgi:hypothetical protein
MRQDKVFHFAERVFNQFDYNDIFFNFIPTLLCFLSLIQFKPFFMNKFLFLLLFALTSFAQNQPPAIFNQKYMTNGYSSAVKYDNGYYFIKSLSNITIANTNNFFFTNWTVTLTNSTNQAIQSYFLTNDNSLICLTYDFGTDNRYYITKINQMGSIVWTYTINHQTTVGEQVFDIQEKNNEVVFVSTKYANFAQKTSLIRLNSSNGTLISENIYDFESKSLAFTTDAQSNFVFYSQLIDYQIEYNTLQLNFIGLDANRNISKRTRIKVNATSFDVFKLVKNPSNDSFYAVGNLYGLPSKDAPILGNNDVFIHKIDNQGNLTWEKHIASSGDEYFKKVVFDANQNIYIAGNINSAGGGDFPSIATTYDTFVAKITPLGALEWVKPLSRSSYDEHLEMIIHNNYLYHLSRKNNQNHQGFVITKLALDGSEQWNEEYRGSGASSTPKAYFQFENNKLVFGRGGDYNGRYDGENSTEVNKFTFTELDESISLKITNITPSLCGNFQIQLHFTSNGIPPGTNIEAQISDTDAVFSSATIIGQGTVSPITLNISDYKKLRFIRLKTQNYGKSICVPYEGAYKIQVYEMPKAMCLGQIFSVGFDACGVAGPYQVQLSNRWGDFSTPNVLGTFSASPASIQIPNNSEQGNSYRFRVVAVNSPTEISTESNSFSISSTSGLYIYGSYGTSTCGTATYQVDAYPTATYQWYQSGVLVQGQTTNTITVNKQGQYQCSVNIPSCGVFNSGQFYFNPNIKFSIDYGKFDFSLCPGQVFPLHFMTSCPSYSGTFVSDMVLNNNNSYFLGSGSSSPIQITIPSGILNSFNLYDSYLRLYESFSYNNILRFGRLHRQSLNMNFGYIKVGDEILYNEDYINNTQKIMEKTNYTLFSAKSITLSPGFETSKDVVFKAKATGCTN